MSGVTQTSGTAGTTGDTITALFNSVVGTCVETLDEDGNTLAAGREDVGNYAICHWWYYIGRSNNTGITAGGTTGTDYGETRYYTEKEWGVHGSGLTGANIQTRGTALSSGEGFALSHSSLTAYVAGNIYTQTWYQPSYSSTYASTNLRRYNGGMDNFDRVKVYCMGPRMAQPGQTRYVDVVAVTQAGIGGVVSLSGASTLAASAIVFGMASLSF